MGPACRFHKSLIGVATIGAAAVFVSYVHGAEAASVSASASVTISASAGIGVVSSAVTTTDSANVGSTSTSITSAPVSTTSNVGLYSDPAPVAASEDQGGDATATAASSATASATPTGAARRFPTSNAVPIGIGTGSAIAVAGSPNQTYSIMLPEQTAYASGAEIVSIEEFQHNAGQTPAMDSSGSDVFAVGATVSTAPAAATAGPLFPSAFSNGPAIVSVVLLFD